MSEITRRYFKQMKIKSNLFAHWALVVTLFFPFCVATAETSKLSESTWVFSGDGYSVSAANKGRVTNIGYIETKQSGVIVNTGISHNHAEQIMRQISEISDKEKLDAIIVQGTQKFALGAFSLKKVGVKTYAHPRAIAQIAQRCSYCIQYLEETLGEVEMEHTKVDEPQDIALLDLSPSGPLRDILLIDHGDTKSKGAIMIYHKPSKVLFSGDVVFSGVIPNIKDSNFAQWKKSLRLLRDLPISVIIPGVGPKLTKSAISDSLDYLDALDVTTKDLYRNNQDLLSATKKATLTQFSDWQLYNEHHPNNVMYRYLQIEEGDLTIK